MVFQLCFSSHYACIIIIILMDLISNYNIEMEFRKARFAKRSDRYPRNDRTQGEQGSRSGGSRYGGSSGGGSRYGGSSRFNRGSDGNRRIEMHNAICGDCGNECEIPFKPKDSRPVYCRECFQNHKPQEPSVSGFNRNDKGLDTAEI